MVGRTGASGWLSARERANGVHGEDAGVSGWRAGFAIDRDEKALRGGGGGGKEEGYLVGVRSVPSCGPRRLSHSPTGTGSSSIPDAFPLFYAQMQISLVCHPCGEVVRTDDAQTGASPRTHAYTHSHTPLVVLHPRAMSSA